MEVAVEDIAFGESIGAFQIARSENVASDDGARNIRRVLGNCANDAVAQQFAIFVPRALAKFVRNVLHEAGHNMLAGGRKRWVGVRSNYAIDPKLFGNFSELGDVIATLREFKRGDEGKKR